MSSRGSTRNRGSVRKQPASRHAIRTSARSTSPTDPAPIIQRARFSPGSLTGDDALRLQSTIGNRAVGRLLAHGAEPATRGGRDGGENRTGMPDALKGRLEALSGVDLSGIRVHYNSTKPAQLDAHAYTQGGDIYVGPGQTAHLAHEGWHAVQQRRQRVKPTMHGHGASISDDPALEREAGVMGAKALRLSHADATGAPAGGAPAGPPPGAFDSHAVIQRCKKDPSCQHESPCPVHEKTLYNRARRQRQRLAGATRSSFIGAGNVTQELERTEKEEAEMLAQFDVSKGHLEAAKREPWAQKRLARAKEKLGQGFDAEFGKDAGRGETTGEGIKIGAEGLTSPEMARVTLRHELDHAKLRDPESKLMIGPYRVRDFVRGEKGTFQYQLEEVLVRLRDYEHASTGNKVGFTEGFSEKQARERIDEAYMNLLNATDFDDVDPTYKEEILAKVQDMRFCLYNPL